MTPAAPYPATAADATAAALAEYLACSAYIRWRALPHIKAAADNGDLPHTAYLDHTAALTTEYGLVIALTTDQVPAQAADAAARRIWQAWQQGEQIGVDLLQRLIAHGHDPEQLDDLADHVTSRLNTTCGKMAGGQ